MASEEGVAVENESVVTEKMNNVETVSEPKREEANGGDGGGGKTPNEDVETSEYAKRPQNLDSAAVKAESESVDENAQEAKISKPVKEASSQESVTPKKSKTAKDKPVSKRQGTFSRSPRFLSQSLSFPSRGPHADVTRKSIDSASKASVKPVLANGPKPKVSASTSSKRTSLVATLHKKQTAPAKPSSKDASPGPTSEVSKLADKDSKPVKSEIPSKDDEDARSTTTSTSTPHGRRSTGSASGFSFRLEERAEKRKEFYIKLEEKIHAKEVEKSNLQAKSKENQEAEIKRLRKSLTFKAAPMPSFYKEPPPKVELKKIPTTRPISPKLGRKKGNTDATGGDAGSCASPRLSRENTSSTKGTPKPKDSSLSKKPVTKPQPKLQTRGDSSAAAAKTEKLVKPKPNTTELSKKAKRAEEDENPAASDKPKEEQNSASDVLKANGTSDEREKPNSEILKAEIMTSEVVVGG